jgi:DNA-binding Lrp family transcriptional regulator
MAAATPMKFLDNPAKGALNQAMLSETEQKVIAAIQGDIPITAHPYRELAARVGMEETAFLEILEGLRARSIIRRFGATLRHQKSGYAANAMGAWQVPEERIESVGDRMATCRQISHCYRRNPNPNWPYNLYTMIHAESPEACWEIAREMARATDIEVYTLLFSLRELKKTSMTYFSIEDQV